MWGDALPTQPRGVSALQGESGAVGTGRAGARSLAAGDALGCGIISYEPLEMTLLW